MIASSKFCFGFVHGSVYGTAAGIWLTAVLGCPVPLIAWLTLATAIVLSVYIRLYEEQRWQQASRVTQIVRYCWFRPLRFLKFCWWVVKWAACGLKPLEYPPVVADEWPGLKFTRRETLQHLWTLSVSMSQWDCQNWLTLLECRTQLKVRHENNT